MKKTINSNFLRGNLRSIDLFLRVMECGTTQRAAELMHTTQPTVSKAIAALEDQLDLELFTRSGGRLQPTIYAYRLQREAEIVRAEFNAFERRIHEIKHDRLESLSFESAASLSIAMIPQAIASFKLRYPDVKISFNVSNVEQILINTRKGITDFGLLHFPSDAPYPGAQVFYTSRLVCILPKGHALENKRVITPHDLRNVRFISYRASLPYSHLIESAFEEEGVPYQVDITVNHSAAVYSIVNAGYGAAIVDSFFIPSSVFHNVVERPFIPQRNVTAGIITAKHRALSEHTEAFIEHLKDSYGDHRPESPHL